MKTIEIKNKDGSLIYSYTCEGNTVKKTLERGVKKGICFQRANFQNADFQGADLWNANLKEANLQEANLQNANLQNANLQEANLRYGYFQGADFRGADLRYGYFQGADFRGADLWNANFQNANLQEANLWGANVDYSCLPLWCGAKFKADERICKQLVAHTLRIMELSGEGNPELLKLMTEYKAGWHRENEF